MAAELGLVGLLAFGLMVGGVAAAARRALGRRRALAAGPTAALVVWLLHASIDWDWQLPAVTLPAIALAGGLSCSQRIEPADRRPRPIGRRRITLARERQQQTPGREVVRLAPHDVLEQRRRLVARPRRLVEERAPQVRPSCRRLSVSAPRRSRSAAA